MSAARILKLPRPAVFLDRDGVLIEDVDLLTDSAQLNVLPSVADTLVTLKRQGFMLVVVTNQPVVARGLVTERGVRDLHIELALRLGKSGARVDAWYFCPHHPHADVAEYRKTCDCRKPQPGMLKRAAIEHAIALEDSFMIGDRTTDIQAGAAAGCTTIHVETGKHRAVPIVGADAVAPATPDHVCADLAEAGKWILQRGASHASLCA